MISTKSPTTNFVISFTSLDSSKVFSPHLCLCTVGRFRRHLRLHLVRLGHRSRLALGFRGRLRRAALHRRRSLAQSIFWVLEVWALTDPWTGRLALAKRFWGRIFSGAARGLPDRSYESNWPGASRMGRTWFCPERWSSELGCKVNCT